MYHRFFFGATGLNLFINSDTANYNVFSAAGSPSSPISVTLTVSSAVQVYSNTTATAGITIGAFPVGSTILIINKGFIVGAGGNGGNAGSPPGSGAYAGTPGLAAGPALTLTAGVATLIDNALGFIYGGGGGGGGGTSSCCSRGVIIGGRGGGGQGRIGGLEGTFGNTSGSGNGSFSGPGTGGPGGGCCSSTAGGNGGAWGTAGAGGGSSAGGAAGRAATTNGVVITWLSGFNGTQVKGPIV